MIGQKCSRLLLQLLQKCAVTVSNNMLWLRMPGDCENGLDVSL